MKHTSQPRGRAAEAHTVGGIWNVEGVLDENGACGWYTHGSAMKPCARGAGNGGFDSFDDELSFLLLDELPIVQTPSLIKLQRFLSTPQWRTQHIYGTVEDLASRLCSLERLVPTLSVKRIVYKLNDLAFKSSWNIRTM